MKPEQSNGEILMAPNSSSANNSEMRGIKRTADGQNKTASQPKAENEIVEEERPQENGSNNSLNKRTRSMSCDSLEHPQEELERQRDYDPNNRVYSMEQLEVLNLVVHPIWIFDYVERRMRWANDAGLEMWNATSLIELQTRSFQEISAASARRMEDYLVQFDQGMHVTDQWTNYPNGKATTCHMNVSGVKFSHDEDHLSIMCEGVPVVKEKLLQDNLRGVEMIRHLPMAVCQFDIDGRLQYQNPEARFSEKSHDKAEAATTKKEEETNSNDNSSTSTSHTSDSGLHHGANLVDRFVETKVGEDLLKEIRSPLKNSVDTEAMVKTRKGSRWSAIQLRKGKDPVTGADVILYSANDRSDAVRAREEKKAREEKSEFLAIMAHEIRTPLHQVTGFIDLLNQTDLTPEQKSFVKLLKTSAQGLMTVISDVLDYSKLEAGKMKLEEIPYEPLGVVEGSLSVVRPNCEERKLTLKLDWDKHIPFKLKGDPNRLRQIILNLLSNAVKFTKEGGITVKVTVEKGNRNSSSKSNGSANSPPNGNGSLLRIEVTDTGLGICEEHKTGIFRKYQQANTSIARAFGGTGLGLSICQLLVETMGGKIGVESELGRGSTFWFYIRAAIPGEDEASEATDELPFDDNGSLKILIAEDNKVNQKLLREMLKRLGHTSEVATNGKEAVDMVTQSGGYDVVLMDIQMPVMDGIEATRRLRSMGYKDLPIYGLTASVARSDFHDLGLDDWLPKPIPMKSLRSKLSQVKPGRQDSFGSLPPMQVRWQPGDSLS